MIVGSSYVYKLTDFSSIIGFISDTTLVCLGLLDLSLLGQLFQYPVIFSMY